MAFDIGSCAVSTVIVGSLVLSIGCRQLLGIFPMAFAGYLVAIYFRFFEDRVLFSER